MCFPFLLFCLCISSLLYSSFILQVLIILQSTNVDPKSNNWYRRISISVQQPSPWSLSSTNLVQGRAKQLCEKTQGSVIHSGHSQFTDEWSSMTFHLSTAFNNAQWAMLVAIDLKFWERVAFLYFHISQNVKLATAYLKLVIALLFFLFKHDSMSLSFWTSEPFKSEHHALQVYHAMGHW